MWVWGSWMRKDGGGFVGGGVGARCYHANGNKGVSGLGAREGRFFCGLE